MKIKINGDLKRTEKEFACEFCGCVFTADASEYDIDFKYRTSTVETIRKKCPCCHATVIYNESSAVMPASVEDKENVKKCMKG